MLRLIIELGCQVLVDSDDVGGFVAFVSKSDVPVTQTEPTEVMATLTTGHMIATFVPLDGYVAELIRATT